MPESKTGAQPNLPSFFFFSSYRITYYIITNKITKYITRNCKNNHKHFLSSFHVNGKRSAQHICTYRSIVKQKPK